MKFYLINTKEFSSEEFERGIRGIVPWTWDGIKVLLIRYTEYTDETRNNTN